MSKDTPPTEDALILFLRALVQSQANGSLESFARLLSQSMIVVCKDENLIAKAESLHQEISAYRAREARKRAHLQQRAQTTQFLQFRETPQRHSPRGGINAWFPPVAVVSRRIPYHNRQYQQRKVRKETHRS